MGILESDRNPGRETLGSKSLGTVGPHLASCMRKISAFSLEKTDSHYVVKAGLILPPPTFFLLSDMHHHSWIKVYHLAPSTTALRLGLFITAVYPN